MQCFMPFRPVLAAVSAKLPISQAFRLTQKTKKRLCKNSFVSLPIFCHYSTRNFPADILCEGNFLATLFFLASHDKFEMGTMKESIDLFSVTPSAGPIWGIKASFKNILDPDVDGIRECTTVHIFHQKESTGDTKVMYVFREEDRGDLRRQ